MPDGGPQLRPALVIALSLPWVAFAADAGGAARDASAVTHAAPASDAGLADAGLADAGLADAGLAADAASPAPVRAPDASPPPPRPVLDASAMEALRAEVDALRTVVEPVEGAPPPNVAALFNYALTNEDAVAADIELIESRLPGEYDVPPDAATALTRERDRLRLAILRRPAEVRAQMAERWAATQRIAVEQAAAARAREAAAAEAARADAARLEALADAERTRNAARAALAEERARALDVTTTLANRRKQLAETRTAGTEDYARRLEETNRFRQTLDGGALPPEDALTLHDELLSAYAGARDLFAGALDALDAPPPGIEFEPRVDPDDRRFDTAPEARRALAEAVETLHRRQGAYRDELTAWRLARAQGLADLVHDLHAMSLEVLERVPAARRSATLGVSPEGMDQLRRELDHLELGLRWYPRRRLAELAQAEARMEDVFALGRMTWVATQLLVLLLLALLTRARARGWVRSLQRSVWRRTQDPRLAGILVRWLGHLRAVSREVGLLIVVWLAAGLMREAAGIIEIELAYDVLIAYAVYRLCLAMAHRFITSAVSHGRVEVGAALSDRILRSIRIAGRTALVVVLLLLISRTLLGEGYLHTLTRRLAWLLVVPMAWVLLRHWRDDVLRVYRAHHPDGRFVAATSRFEGRALGTLVAVPVAAVVIAGGLGAWLSDMAMNFEQTRRALAFLYGRQLERRASSIGRGGVDVEALPTPLRQAFEPCPVADDRVLPHFPELDRVLAHIEAARSGGPGLAVAIVGERGCGKTSWLMALHERLGKAAPPRVRVSPRQVTEAAACSVLSEVVQAQSALTRPEPIAEMARDQEPRVFLLDGCQNFVLRAVGGHAGYEAFAEVVSRTIRHHVWVCAFSRYTWAYLQHVYPQQNVFSLVVDLDAWPEERIRALIEHRMALAQVTPSYEDLVLAPSAEAMETDELGRTSARYIRLLWDYADGNPGIALHFWLRSLVPGDTPDTVRVRLFDDPDAAELAALREEARFVLKAVVFHETITAEEAARVLNYDRSRCEAVLDYLLGRGYLTVSGDRYRIDVRWFRAVVRFLKRKNLLG